MNTRSISFGRHAPASVWLFGLAMLALPVQASEVIEKVSYGAEPRQRLNLYLADRNSPAPVFVYAHANGGNAKLPRRTYSALNGAGFSIVSWESISRIKRPEQAAVVMSDARKVMAWVKANAKRYNLDPDQLVIGGSSRGSIVSWEIAHSGDPSIKGLYMMQALPRGAWRNTDRFDPLAFVHAESPALYLVYLKAPGQDSHDPALGMRVEKRYRTLGIGGRVTLVHSLEQTGNADRFQFLPAFMSQVVGD